MRFSKNLFLAGLMVVSVLVSCKKEDGAKEPKPLFDASRVGVCSWSWGMDVPSVLKQMKLKGIGGIQLATTPWVVDELSEEQKKDFGGKEPLDVLTDLYSEVLLGELDIMSTMVSFPYEEYTSRQTVYDSDGLMFTKDKYGHDPEEVWKEEREILGRAALLTWELGVKYLTLMPGFLSKDWDLAMERVKEACDTCSKYDVILLLDTGEDSAEDLANFLDKMDVKYPDIQLGVSFDPGNFLIYQSGDPIKAFDTLFPWIGQIHVTDGIENAAWDDCLVAWGEGDVSGKYNFLQHVHDSEYSGNLLIEVGSMVDGDKVSAIMSAYNAMTKK